MTPLDYLMVPQNSLVHASCIAVKRCWPEPPVDQLACVVLCAALAWIELHQ